MLRRHTLLFLVVMTVAPITKVASVEEGLAAFVEGKLVPEQLVVTYSDLHGLWGGLEIIVEGTGKVTQRAVRVETRPARTLNREEVLRVVKLLIQLAMWEQRIPERTPNPDEGRAHLKIQIGERSSEIWEWYNDLEENARLIQVRELMKSLAWSEP